MFNNKAKRILSLAVAGITVLSLAGCKSEKQTADGKIQITVSQWPSKDGDPIKYESRMKLKEDFEKKYPDILPHSFAVAFWNFAGHHAFCEAQSASLCTQAAFLRSPSISSSPT